MKTGMEYPLIVMLVIVAIMALMQAWNGMQVDLSVSALNATIAGQKTPEPVMIATQWLMTGGGIVILAAVLAGGGYALWSWWKKHERQDAHAWKKGPNANWGRQPPQPRAPSEAELMRMALLRSLAGQGQAPPRVTVGRQEGEDEPEINF